MAQDQNNARNIAGRQEPPSLSTGLSKTATNDKPADKAAPTPPSTDKLAAAMSKPTGAMPPPIPPSPPKPAAAAGAAKPEMPKLTMPPSQPTPLPSVSTKPAEPKLTMPPPAPLPSASTKPETPRFAAPPPAPPPASPKAQPAPPPPAAAAPTPSQPLPSSANTSYIDDDLMDIVSPSAPGPRRPARRRAAGPVRGKVAANDDAPSIGGLIYALEQKPSGKPFFYAAVASAIWAVIGIGFAIAIISAELGEGTTFAAILSRPTTFLTVAAILVPIAVLWFLALLAWRTEELRLRSSTMTEVAVRLAEPDRMAEQSVASLGQAVRRQVSFMNDAVSRALGRAGELEALVHNEVTALERSYEDNERKIRGLIQELTGERHALLNTSERVAETLRSLGTEVPTLIEKLSSQQVKLAHIIQGAGENLNSLESAIGQSAGRLETTLGAKTEHLQAVLEGYTTGLATALGSRADQMQTAFGEYIKSLDSTLSNRTTDFQTVFEEYARALDTTLSNRAQALDIQLVERTKSLDAAFNERLQLFDESILRSTMAIDGAVGEKARALTSALDVHAKTFSETIGRQAHDLDESLMHGINSVRRTSESITRQSLKAIEGLSGQSEMLKSISENLLGQIHTVTNRFENQGESILKAATALESANYKIDNTLQTRHADLNRTLERMSGKADEFGRFVEGYSSSIEGTLTEAEKRARAAAEELRASAEARQRLALADIERFKAETGAESDRVLDELRRRFALVSNEVSEQLGSLSSRLGETTDEVRARAARAAAEIAHEQNRLREQLESLPHATRENADAMRRALQDQLRALEHLSALTSRHAAQRDVAAPISDGSLTGNYASAVRASDAASGRSINSLSSTLAHELSLRGRAPAEPPRPIPGQQSLPRPSSPSGSGDGREGWSVGDLLARASRDDDSHHYNAPIEQPPAVPPHQPYTLNVEVIARALDPSTTAAIWSRIRAGQRGIMVKSIYSGDGRAAFDEVSKRLKTDPELQRTVGRYLSDFERIQREAEQKDPSGRLAHNHLVSDTGRVYLFLAHASGRLG